VIGRGVATNVVLRLYALLIQLVGGELQVLEDASLPGIAAVAGDDVLPGYGGVYGCVRLTGIGVS
jgi:PHP family Zn ribbon phosphoesterase